MPPVDRVPEIRAKHKIAKLRLGDRNPNGTNRYSQQCLLCREPWPCDAIMLAAQIEEERRAAPKVRITPTGQEYDIPISALQETAVLFASEPMYELEIAMNGTVYTFRSSRMTHTPESEAMVRAAGFFE